MVEKKDNSETVKVTLKKGLLKTPIPSCSHTMMTDLSLKSLLPIKQKPPGNLVNKVRSARGHTPSPIRKPPGNLASTACSARGRRPINRKRGIFPLASKGICLFSALRGLLHYNIYDFLWYVDFFDYVAGEFICDCSFSGF